MSPSRKRARKGKVPRFGELEADAEGADLEAPLLDPPPDAPAPPADAAAPVPVPAPRSGGVRVHPDSFGTGPFS